VVSGLSLSVGANPAEELSGLTLPGGWKVQRKLPRAPGGSGGNFSVGYEVEGPDGSVAFLKALDYSSAFGSPDPARALQYMTTAFNFERDMVFACKRRGMSRIVTAIGDGSVMVPNAPIYPVDYLIFERAEKDARSHLAAMQSFDLAWVLRSLHHATTGHRQMHEHGMAHRDLKPSNVLVFGDGGTKLTDLGRGWYSGHTSPYDQIPIAGDRSYAPPELLYGQVSPDWRERCLGTDVYLLGSLVHFYFTKVGITAALLTELDPAFRPKSGSGTYAQVLPHVRDGFDRALAKSNSQFPDAIRSEMDTVIRQMCDPDPTTRGHPRNRIGTQNRFGLERFESKFDLLARRAEQGLI
jgi:eukaryotic-like serine/threonine-protein kinase